MSMISMQCDELRKLAKAFPETSPRNTLLIDAADLILELRDDLQCANAENAKLREENKSLRTVAVKYYTELLHSDDVLGQIMARKKLKELGAEVGK